MFYFAYGDDMDPATLTERGIVFVKVCTGTVRNLRLVFDTPGTDGTGKADLQDFQGGSVEGVIYEIPERSLANLSVVAGADRGHYRLERVTVQTSRGELDCRVYRATKFRHGLKPAPDYLQTLVRGAESHRLSTGYQTFLRSHDTTHPVA